MPLLHFTKNANTPTVNGDLLTNSQGDKVETTISLSLNKKLRPWERMTPSSQHTKVILSAGGGDMIRTRASGLSL